ncbi:D-alanyl-D-alanine carboxypeptidase family protein [Actinomadura rugatobispora]|uniref:D-alanyl-D-alanine carboxypeptidase family protein n=1 Tax=Actinomadura rugatobispora TaxID=1994 RepID=A0ABW0ZRY3_9ACTN|nr:hypothetical protein GCM10010200_059100 [Actinomadura rugatobispora]
MQDPAPLKDPAQPPAESSDADGAPESPRSGTAAFRTAPASGAREDDAEGSERDEDGPEGGGGEPPEDDAEAEATGEDSAPERAEAEEAIGEKPEFSALIFNSAGQWTIPAPTDEAPAAEPSPPEPPAPEPPAAEPAAAEAAVPEAAVPEAAVPEAAVPEAAVPEAAVPEEPEQEVSEPEAPPADEPVAPASATVPEIDRKIAPKVAPETVPEIDVAAARPKPPPPPEEPDPLGLTPEPVPDEPQGPPDVPAPEPEPEPEPDAQAFYEDPLQQRGAPEARPSAPVPADAWEGWPQSSHTAPPVPREVRPQQEIRVLPQEVRLPQGYASPPTPAPAAPQEQTPQAYAQPPAQPQPRVQPPPPQPERPQQPPQEYSPGPPHHQYGETPPAYGAAAPPHYGPVQQDDQQTFGEARDFAAAYEAAASEVKGRKKRRRGLISLIIVLVLLAGGAAGQLVRPVPEPRMQLTLPASTHTFPGSAPVLPLPVQGQSALYVDGIGPMGASGGTVPTPTASVAKVMTAYVFLRSHPLASGQPGPIYTVSPQAAAQMPERRERGESLLGVTAGMRLTERKALEALMIISANDVAHELARWDAGDPRAFVQKMNDTARTLGMTSTRYTDPSGYDSGTVSTAADQVKLLRAAMDVPAFAEIVSKRSYVPDDGGAVRAGGNVLIGQYGVVGGKTGYTDAAGGNFVFAARRRLAGVDVLFLGAVMGQRSPSALGALRASRDLLAAAQRTLTSVTLAQGGARVGRVDDGLGGFTPVRAAAPITVVGWPGLTVRIRVDGDPPRTAAQGTRVGSVKAGAADVPLELGQRLEEPSILKRLIRLG